MKYIIEKGKPMLVVSANGYCDVVTAHKKLIIDQKQLVEEGGLIDVHNFDQRYRTYDSKPQQVSENTWLYPRRYFKLLTDTPLKTRAWNYMEGDYFRLRLTMVESKAHSGKSIIIKQTDVRKED